MNTTQSPEITGAWLCACGNKTDFVGIDAHGYGGPDECENPGDCPNRGAMPEDCCGCETELVQPFSVLYGEDGSYERGDLEYERFEGGGSDSEIGAYTKIICADCGATLWKEPEGATLQGVPVPSFQARNGNDPVWQADIRVTAEQTRLEEGTPKCWSCGAELAADETMPFYCRAHDPENGEDR